jgi:hypothetical protein
MTDPVCTGVPQFPTWADASPRYRALFNATAKDLKLPLEYTNDRIGPSCRNNVPEVACAELAIMNGDTRYQVRGSNVNQSILTRDVCTVRKEVERRRLVMNRAGMKVFPVSHSTTYSEKKIDMLNSGERAWFAAVGQTFYDVSLALYGVQATRQSGKTTQWMRTKSDAVSLFHYDRSRHTSMPTEPVKAFADSAKYASSVPWFPSNATFNFMWPEDFSIDELAHINKAYDAQDPIRLPYTRVRRMTEGQARILEAQPHKNSQGAQIEWVRRGPKGEYYHVRNIAFDREMRPQFMKLVTALRVNAP